MLNLEIVTPEKKVVDETVDSVRIPTANGEIGILPNHAPLISILKPGILRFLKGTSTMELVISGGFIEVNANKVSILADIAESSDEVDIDQAKSERETVEKLLGDWKGSEEEFEIELERLEKARARLELATKN